MSPEAAQTRILIILTSVLAICFCCTASLFTLTENPDLPGRFQAMIPTRRPTAAFTVTPVPTATASPTASATVTAVRVATVLNFPGRTPGPAPSPTFSDSDNAALQRYHQQASGHLASMATAMDTISRLSQNPRLRNEEWVIQMGFSIGTIQGAYSALSNLDPPAAIANYHRSLLDALGDCDRAAAIMADGLINEDPDELFGPADLLNSCAKKAANLELPTR